jgi:hypothetical protein
MRNNNIKKTFMLSTALLIAGGLIWSEGDGAFASSQQPSSG